MPGGGRPRPDPRRQGRGEPGSWGDRSGGRAEQRAGAGRLGPAATGAPAFRWLGTLSTRAAILIVLAAGLVGVLGTVVTGKEPGFLLGLCVIVGSVVAAITIRRPRLHTLIPLPALIFFIGAVLTGGYHDRSLDTSTTELGVSFLQWIADVFFPMCAATILVLVIAGGRWLMSRQLVSGQFAFTGSRGSADRGPRSRPAPHTRPDPAARPGLRPGAAGRDGRGGSPDVPDSWGNRGGNPDRDRWGTSNQRNRGNRWGTGDGRDDRPDRPDRDRPDRPRRT